MSHFIENTYDLECQQIIKVRPKKIIFPSFQFTSEISLLKLSKEKMKNKQNPDLLKSIIKKYKNEEQEKEKHIQCQEINSQIGNLKKRLRRNAFRKSIENILSQSPENNHLDIRKINQMKVEYVDLMKKHRNKILIKLENIQQAENLDQQKEKYKKWYNTAKNSPTQSPIFTKITYLIEKMNKTESTKILPRKQSNLKETLGISLFRRIKNI